jgi:CBS domain-containing protein
MKSVSELLDRKGGQVWAVAPGDSVLDAIRLMAEKGIGAVLVRDGERLAGILSERDYARKIILQGKSSKDTPVREIMTSELITVRPSQTVQDCMALMTQSRIRHLPVVEGEKLVGILSIGDLVKEVIEDQKFQIQQLQSYIAT